MPRDRLLAGGVLPACLAAVAVLATILLAAPGAARAGEPSGRREITLASLLPESMLPGDAVVEVAMNNAQAVPDHSLSELRGGFIFAGGLALDFAIEVATQLNGELVSRTRLSTVDGSIFDPSQLHSLLQLGPGNVLAPTALANANGAITLIQNTLPNSLIQHVTTATLNVHNFAPVRDQIVHAMRSMTTIQFR